MEMLDRFVGWFDSRVDRLWAYLLALSPEEFNALILGLFGIGLVLCTWLLYSIYRRSPAYPQSRAPRVRSGVTTMPALTGPAPGPMPGPREDRWPAPAVADRELAGDLATSAAPAAPRAEAAPTPEGLFTRLRGGLAATRGALVERLDGIFAGRSTIDAELFEELEEVLITSDVGVQTAGHLLAALEKRAREERWTDAAEVRRGLEEQVREILRRTAGRPRPRAATPPNVIMVVGVNGTGKTTSIGKLAQRFRSEGLEVMLAAGDTFRAAAIEQLEIWGERAGVPVVRQKAGADPSAVAYDAVQSAVARGVDLLIVDTAGRMHTQRNLMEEIKKVKRVMGKELPGAPHETLLVLDATTGQNAIAQARQFHQALDLDGIVLTKLDGTAKGGVIIGICDELDLPVRFIGIGEGADDLRPFDAEEFAAALFAG